jgi:hypothetical protein
MPSAYEDKLDAIVAICAAANPDIRQRAHPTKIRCADVALALITDAHTRRSNKTIADLAHWWNLSSDCLSAQSDECVGFLFDRLRELRLPEAG